MALYNDLTNEEKQNIGRYDTFMRGVTSSLMNLHKNSDPSVWNQFAMDNVDSVVASLNSGEIIPNNTGLGGAKDLTKEEFLTLQGIIRTLSTTADDNIGLIVKSVGVNA